MLYCIVLQIVFEVNHKIFYFIKNLYSLFYRKHHFDML